MSKDHKKSFSSNFGKEIEILALPLSKVLNENSVKEIYLLSQFNTLGDDSPFLRYHNYYR